MIILWIAVSFLSGSLMFSYWLGLIAHHNLKTIGDGNPGALNLWKAAGYPYGLAGITLDVLKGYVPLAYLVNSGTVTVTGYEVVLVAAAPVLGHAFSPFLRGRGGKAIAVTFGVWSALTGFAASLAYAVILALLLTIARWVNKGKPTSAEADGFQVVFGMLLLAVYLFGRNYSHAILSFWFCNFLLLVYTHRQELRTFFQRMTA